MTSLDEIRARLEAGGAVYALGDFLLGDEVLLIISDAEDLIAALVSAEARITKVADAAQEGLANCDDDCDMSAFWVLTTLTEGATDV